MLGTGQRDVQGEALQLPPKAVVFEEKKPNNFHPQVRVLISTLLTPAAGLGQEQTTF